jgi:hypothetical protein
MADADDRLEISVRNRVQMTEIVPMAGLGDKTATIKLMLGTIMTVWQADKASR